MKTKRNLRQMWLLGVLLLAMPAAVKAQFIFTTNNGTITISSYTGAGGVVLIPGTTNGYSVTGIGNAAFSNKTSVTSMTLPNTVTNIGTNAFYACTGLTNVTLGSSVTNIGSSAFFSCTKLASMTIPNSVTNIGFSAFQSCSSLTNLILGSNVIGIGYNAFQSCTKLPSVTLPDKVRGLGSGTFQFCNSLTNVIIGSNVTDIDSSAFQSCFKLTAINVGALNLNFSSVVGVLFDKNQTKLVQYPEGIAGSYVIPNTVTNVGIEAFRFCTLLTNVTIPNSVIRIEEGSFQGSALTGVVIPASVSYIGDIAFNFCNHLTNIMVDINNPFYSSLNGVLVNKEQTTLIQYPGGRSGSYTIPSGITNIANYAFGNCSGLTSVSVPHSVTDIGVAAFYVCTSLTNVYFQGNVPNVDTTAFEGVNATVYYLPGTTGWSSMFGGVPTVLWLPRAQTTDSKFGIQNNQFGFNINWASAQTVVVEACTNLFHPDWQPLQTNTLTTGSAYFSDPQWTKYPGRFYRLRSP